MSKASSSFRKPVKDTTDTPLSIPIPLQLVLKSLNKEQYAAVTHPSDIPLQILAGPGSGKTKVLTARIAHLITAHGIPPGRICAVTFTNKAAAEMKERLEGLLGGSAIQREEGNKGKSNGADANITGVVLGTFHALSAKFLRRYGKSIGLRQNFTICDAEESKQIIRKILKTYADELDARGISLKDTTILTAISKAKAQGLSAEDLLKKAQNEAKARARVEPAAGYKTVVHQTITADIDIIIASVYKEYTSSLKESNSLDFDDLLIYGVRLFGKEKRSRSWCGVVVVDEFQDTNSMQYELMLRLSDGGKCITIVGDPDQSIYGWRSADITNLGRMCKDFPGTKQILLEQNYRSTGSILAASLAIVEQDKSRIAKSLRTSHAPGPLPSLIKFSSEYEEADFIAGEIKRLIAHSGGLLGWNDFVILLRFNALSRVIEAALQKEGIPNRVLAGQKFFERAEIKDILSYLQIIDNPSYTPAFIRAAHTPSRGIGEKSISELTTRAKQMGISPMELAEQIWMGKTPDIKPAVKRKLDSLVKPVVMLRKLANEGATVQDLIKRLLVLVEYETHLKKQQDWETRWENVQELISFASQSMPGKEDAIPVNREDEVIDLTEENEGGEPTDLLSVESPLRRFLEASMLSTDVETKDEEKTNEKVTISTCHSAKGLEWSVVFVPAVEEKVFPFYRTTDIEEERRLLYVACTRAQGLLYLSYTTERTMGGDCASKSCSDFVSKLRRTLFSTSWPSITANDRINLAKVIRREPISEEVVEKKIREYDATNRIRLPKHDFLFPFPTAPAFSILTDRLLYQSYEGASTGVPPARSSTMNAQIASVDPAHSRPSRPKIQYANVGNKGRSARATAPSKTAQAAACVPSKSTTQFGNIKSPHPSAPVPQISSSTQQSTSETSWSVMTLGLTEDATSQQSIQSPRIQHGTRLAGGKKRLGMGRPGTNGYPNKKAKSS